MRFGLYISYAHSTVHYNFTRTHTATQLSRYVVDTRIIKRVAPGVLFVNWETPFRVWIHPKNWLFLFQSILVIRKT